MDFRADNAFERLIEMSVEDLDELGFGVVGLDSEHAVTHYNRAESEISGLDRERVIGRRFFIEVAPCCNNFMVAQRYTDEAELDATVDYVFTFKMRPTPVTLRLLQRQGRAFLLVRRSGDA